MLLKCCTQYASKFGKLGSSHMTGKVRFYSNLKERQCYHTTAFISHASKVMLKILKLGFNSMQIVNFQMYKLGLEMAEEPEIKLSTSARSSKKHNSSWKTSVSALLTTPKPLTVWIAINCEKFLKRWKYQATLPAS